MATTTVCGVLTTEGVECPAMRGTDHKLYSLLGDLGGFGPGDPVCVVGEVHGGPSYCMQGITLNIHSITTYAPARSLGGGVMHVPARPKAVVADVLAVQTFLQKSNPPTLLIIALGRTWTQGWSGPELVPVVYIAPPADGIYDFVFMATPPAGPALQTPQWLVAQYEWPAVDVAQVKGVRVAGANGSIVGMLGAPLVVNAALPAHAGPASWVGKTFVPNGQVSNDPNALHEKEVAAASANYLILAPGSVSDKRYDPTRLRVYIDGASKVTAVGWG